MRYSTRGASGPIRRQEDFTTSGALKGARKGSRAYEARRGYLDPQHYDSFSRATYAVWSYATPIAWVTDGRWVRPASKYSPTTSKHQGQCPLDGTKA